MLRALVILTMLLGGAGVVDAYHGGPVRARVLGVDPTDGRVYFRLTAFDESGDLPKFYYLDLDGEDPKTPVRALHLESTYSDPPRVRGPRLKRRYSPPPTRKIVTPRRGRSSSIAWSAPPRLPTSSFP